MARGNKWLPVRLQYRVSRTDMNKLGQILYLEWKYEIQRVCDK